MVVVDIDIIVVSNISIVIVPVTAIYIAIITSGPCFIIGVYLVSAGAGIRRLPVGRLGVSISGCGLLICRSFTGCRLFI